MTYSTFLQKGKSAVLWVYKTINTKITNIYSPLTKRFPVLNQYPNLKYAIIPVILGLFTLVRNLLKIGINEFASWSSGFAGDHLGLAVNERTIVLCFSVLLIGTRIGIKVRGMVKKKTNETTLNYEGA
ncbi:hypothetical protein [Saccharicrinis aurantiacus]|uniref:hypothetical protein n=1 Tax=Saccharicrinis aurantiacus TaxID=1849719 RepID=UPI00094F8144|nr:hypothetical protein [Saccharicrinis aurantiacus]